LGPAIDLILDGGPCRVGIESTIVLVEGDHLSLLRPGGTPLEALRAFDPAIEAAVPDRPSQLAPGRLPQHYAPRTPIRLVHAPQRPAAGSRVGWLSVRPVPCDGYAAREYLSAAGDLVEAAAAFFPALHRLDALGLAEIHAVPCPMTGLGRGINDRLERAAATFR
jgi:L-threonylcarbamoyladenylate synthase